MSTAITKAKPSAGQLEQVRKWIVAGGSEQEIIEAIATTYPDAKARPLIVEAMAVIAKSADADKEIVKGWAIEATRSIYQIAREVGDHATALRAIRQIQDLSER
ncbi:MAG TPA: hypothetical protein VH370_20490 [Humisphaera sp.]|jgi:hypothetical protein|nr:hypothetical protein [Humisphaera sp.]